ncbi:hypothetical protein Btru_043374 [Bulinus truncatus]|nr:hypothetical protein Btru_043374 [Bulinus truncatus]
MSSLLKMLLLTIAFTVLSICCEATRFPITVFADQLCFHGVFLVEGDVIVMVSKNLTLQPNTKCSIQLQSYTGNSLMASIRSYHMDDSYTHSLDCQYESVQLGSKVNPHLLGPLGYCKSDRPTGQYYIGENGTFSYVAGPYSPLSTPHVELLVSEVTIKDTSHGCPSGSFDCDQFNMCIDRQLTCNGYNDCGNNRDEDIECKLTPGVIAGIVIGGIIFILIVVALALFHYKHLSSFIICPLSLFVDVEFMNTVEGWSRYDALFLIDIGIRRKKEEQLK